MVLVAAAACLSAASVVDSNNSQIGSVTFAMLGSEVIVTVAGMADNRRALLSRAGVNGTDNFFIPLGFPLGDTNGTGAVNASDISAVKARFGHAVTKANFQFDLHATGRITAADIAIVKARSGMVLGQ